MPGRTALHRLDASRPFNEKRQVQPTICRTRSKDPLVFDQKNAARVLADIIPGGYRLCGRCWEEEE